MTDCKHLLRLRIKTLDYNAVFAQNDGDRQCIEIGLHQRDIRRSKSMEVNAVTCYCHVSCCLPYIKSLAS